MKNFDEIQQETREAGFGFLMADTDAALTFLSVARTTKNSETRTRNRHNAAVAYAAVQKFRAQTALTEQQTAELDGKLRRVREELASFDAVQPSEG